MDHRSVSAVEPAPPHGLRGRLRIVVIAFHDDIAADADLAERLPVVRHLRGRIVEHTKIA